MTDQVRVLQVMGSLNRGGAESMIMNLYRAIDSKQVQFDFITHGSIGEAFTDEIQRRGGIIYCCPRYTGINHIAYCKWWKDFFENHKDYKILHSHVRSTASIYFFIAKRYDITTIIHSHSTTNGSGVKSVLKRLLQYPLKYEADYFFGCSKEASTWLYGKKIIESTKYFMIKNAIDVSLYKQDQNVRKVYRDQFGIKSDEKLIIHVGRFHESKNHSFLIKVFSALLKKDKKNKLLLVGDGKLRKSIEDMVRNKGIEENVIFSGVRDDVPSLLKSANVFIFPSLWEGLPVSVVEAQAAGLPCLLSDQITRDVNITDLCCYLPIDKGIDIWVDALERAFNMQRKNVSQEIINTGFDIHQSAQWLTNFYKGLVNQKNI